MLKVFKFQIVMGCFGKCFRIVVKFFYHEKPEEKVPKPSEFGMTIAKSSSELEDCVDTNFYKGSSQEALVTESSEENGKKAKKICSNMSCDDCKDKLEMIEKIETFAELEQSAAQEKPIKGKISCACFK